MRLYHRTKERDLVDTINRCYLDADHGHIKLALERLQDLETELGADARISYAEGMLRLDFLGQGKAAHACFVRALELDPGHAFAACNAAEFAPNEAEYRRWSEVALALSPGDAPAIQRKLHLLDLGNPYWQVVMAGVENASPAQGAAMAELCLLTARMPRKAEVDNRRKRAQELRKLDLQAQQCRETAIEDFAPEERLALAEALAELDRTIALDNANAELWNLKSAWCHLMRRYEEVIACADTALKRRSAGYYRPYQNKAAALWQLGRIEEALACAQEGIELAEAGGQQEQILSMRGLVQSIKASQTPPTLTGALPLMAQAVKAASVSADQYLGLIKATPEQMAEALTRNLHRSHPGPADALAYVPMMARALSDVPAETCFVTVHEIAKHDEVTYENAMRATLYIAAHAEPAMQRDALRMLALTLFVPALQPGGEGGVRALYRHSILEVSAAAHGPMSELDRLMRGELGRIGPALPALIADQEPVDDAGRARAMRNIVSKLQGTPPIDQAAPALVPVATARPTARTGVAAPAARLGDQVSAGAPAASATTAESPSAEEEDEDDDPSWEARRLAARIALVLVPVAILAGKITGVIGWAWWLVVLVALVGGYLAACIAATVTGAIYRAR